MVKLDQSKLEKLEILFSQVYSRKHGKEVEVTLKKETK